MNLLLDTHTLIWAAEDRIRPQARIEIEERADEVFVSAASIWEIEIKRALGRLRAPDDLIQKVDASGFARLAVDFEHALEAGNLPPIHRDPFDRMLVAQARLERLTLATADEDIERYDVPVLTVTRS